MTVLRLADLEHVQSHVGATGEALGKLAYISGLAGLEKLRVGHEVLEPGRRSSPPHSHTVREECALVLDGHPTLVLGDSQQELEPGMLVVLGAGGPAHCIENRTDAACTLLTFSHDAPDDEVLFADG